MKEFDKEKFGLLLNKLRNSKDLSRNGMGDLLGVSESTIKRWERGEAVPSMTDVIRICNEFNISLEEVYEGQINIDREVNRKLSAVDSGIESLNEKINGLSDQLVLIQSDKKSQIKNAESENDLTWLWLLLTHIVATAMGFMCYFVSKIGFLEAFISSVLYVSVISYFIIIKKKDSKAMRLFLLYATILEINMIMNYIMFADITPGVINNIELMILNGSMYGFRYFSLYNMKLLLWICIIVYTIWAIYCGYYLIMNKRIIERK